MIYAGTKQEIETKRKAFIRKWRLKCKAVADSLEEAGDKLFTFQRFPEANGRGPMRPAASSNKPDQGHRAAGWRRFLVERHRSQCDRGLRRTEQGPEDVRIPGKAPRPLPQLGLER